MWLKRENFRVLDDSAKYTHPIFEAASLCDEQTIRDIINKGVSVNITSQNDLTILMKVPRFCG